MGHRHELLMLISGAITDRTIDDIRDIINVSPESLFFCVIYGVQYENIKVLKAFMTADYYSLAIVRANCLGKTIVLKWLIKEFRNCLDANFDQLILQCQLTPKLSLLKLLHNEGYDIAINDFSILRYGANFSNHSLVKYYIDNVYIPPVIIDILLDITRGVGDIKTMLEYLSKGYGRDNYKVLSFVNRVLPHRLELLDDRQDTIGIIVYDKIIERRRMSIMKYHHRLCDIVIKIDDNCH